MSFKFGFVLIYFVNVIVAAFGLFEQCNHTLDLKAGQKILINSPLYPNAYPAGTSCRYTLRAPTDHQLNFQCDIDINMVGEDIERCYDEIFYFNREGSELLSGSEYFCGRGSMTRRSFLNRAVISYISTRPPLRLMGIGVKGVTIAGVQMAAPPTTTATTAGAAGVSALNSIATTENLFNPSNVQKNQNKNKNKNKHKKKRPNGANVTGHHGLTTTPRPSVSAGINNAFAYLATLLSNSIETRVFIAPSTQKTHTNAKQKNQRRKATKPTPQVLTTAADSDLLNFAPLPLYNFVGRNGSNPLPAATATAPISEDYTSDSQLTPTPEPLEERDYRILTNSANYDGFPEGAGKGRFSCLVEAVESQCDCGWSTHTLKVVSASGVAGLNEYSSMAGVLTVNYGKIFCGAVIIHHRFLLSAAHCFISAATSRSDLIEVVVGEHDFSTVLESVYTRYYKIDTIILHEHFRATAEQVRNDIALLRTSQTIDWNRGVAPACLPFRSVTGTDGGRRPPIAGQRVETAGWGSISFGGPQSTQLLTARLDVISAEECRSSLGSVPVATFCTYTPGRDTCQYDSGGGLYLREGGRLFVVGIVSYGYGCAARQPSVNTKVASHLRWIKDNTAPLTYCIK
ncbi:serine protease Hayan [Bactrocera dorsalis]|uniref:Serine protease Hayan n=1 Tax=Bactrocera dorsalis TaxID=27457 RepID=A0ABM3K7I6_BACDO|nr:serine protease Hayan [Bactrocera dorsalis]